MVYSFRGAPDGDTPFSGVIKVSGKLYGTTISGGSNNYGAVFEINRRTGAETVVYSFQNNGTDGTKPWAGLINVGGNLFGTTYSGGANQAGTVFNYSPTTGVETVVYSFGKNGSDGTYPVASLINDGGTLYGTTTTGGATGCGCGTVFSVNPTTGAETVVYSFQNNGTDGAYPYAGLINVRGTLYGTTLAGGGTGCENVGCGTVFSVNPTTGAERVLYSFCSQANCIDGRAPQTALTNVRGILYGTTNIGGANNAGTVFEINRTTDAETVVYSFQNNGSDGVNPEARLLNFRGTLYGTTTAGGGTGCGGIGCGTVFSVDPTTGAETVLYSFCSQANCTDGSIPQSGLINVLGTLYGTSNGGANGFGTVFKVTLP